MENATLLLTPLLTHVMGNSTSNFNSQASSSAIPHEVTVETFAGEESISEPKPARPHIRHLSELIDPALLAEDSKAIRSPSGNYLDRNSFFQREDRPLSLRERQERVRQGIRSQSAGNTPTPSPLGASFSLSDAPKMQEVVNKKRSLLCACFGG